MEDKVHGGAVAGSAGRSGRFPGLLTYLVTDQCPLSQQPYARASGRQPWMTRVVIRGRTLARLGYIARRIRLISSTARIVPATVPVSLLLPERRRW